ncbi:MAG: hypothetical protein KDK89_00835 [Alphaproteobacteria bacterium]|nr:hypothetical protein [Alphaproteobacteria bacterium]
MFYIPGFDPRGPLHYHRLYSGEAEKQARVSGYTASVSRRRAVDDFESCWTVTSGQTVTEYRFLRYEDIVRRQWPTGGQAMYGSILNYSWHFLRMGVFAMIGRNSWPGLIAVTYPPLLVIGLFLASTIFGIFLAALLQPALGLLSWLAVPALLALPFATYGHIEKRYNAFWLARSCAFLVDRSLKRVPEIEERCLLFAGRVADGMDNGGADEVLLVAHSVGTHLAITVAARALERARADTRLSLLTLGQAIAMTPDEPPAHQFREDLLAVSMSDRLDWIDVTSAIDGSCIALSDPLALSNVVRPEGARIQPKLVSPRFNRLFTPETYATIRRNFLRTHFQYLMATEYPGDYDYFLITSGDIPLAERFAHLDSVTGFNRFRIGKR